MDLVKAVETICKSHDSARLALHDIAIMAAHYKEPPALVLAAIQAIAEQGFVGTYSKDYFQKIKGE